MAQHFQKYIFASFSCFFVLNATTTSAHFYKILNQCTSYIFESTKILEHKNLVFFTEYNIQVYVTNDSLDSSFLKHDNIFAIKKFQTVCIFFLRHVPPKQQPILQLSHVEVDYKKGNHQYMSLLGRKFSFFIFYTNCTAFKSILVEVHIQHKRIIGNILVVDISAPFHNSSLRSLYIYIPQITLAHEIFTDSRKPYMSTPLSLLPSSLKIVDIKMLSKLWIKFALNFENLALTNSVNCNGTVSHYYKTLEPMRKTKECISHMLVDTTNCSVKSHCWMYRRARLSISSSDILATEQSYERIFSSGSFTHGFKFVTFVSSKKLGSQLDGNDYISSVFLANILLVVATIIAFTAFLYFSNVKSAAMWTIGELLSQGNLISINLNKSSFILIAAGIPASLLWRNLATTKLISLVTARKPPDDLPKTIHNLIDNENYEIFGENQFLDEISKNYYRQRQIYPTKVLIEQKLKSRLSLFHDGNTFQSDILGNISRNMNIRRCKNFAWPGAGMDLFHDWDCPAKSVIISEKSLEKFSVFYSLIPDSQTLKSFKHVGKLLQYYGNGKVFTNNEKYIFPKMELTYTPMYDFKTETINEDLAHLVASGIAERILKMFLEQQSKGFELLFKNSTSKTKEQPQDKRDFIENLSWRSENLDEIENTDDSKVGMKAIASIVYLCVGLELIGCSIFCMEYFYKQLSITK